METKQEYEMQLDLEDAKRSLDALTDAALDLIPKKKHDKLLKKFLRYRRLYDAYYDGFDINRDL